MHKPDIIFNLVAVIGSIVLSIGMFFSRRHIFDRWAKVASVLLCIFGLSWTLLGIRLAHLEASTSGSAHIVLVMMRSFCCGVCVGLLLSILIAKPYKKVTHEK
jgi:hypothetical protein